MLRRTQANDRSIYQRRRNPLFKRVTVTKVGQGRPKSILPNIKVLAQVTGVLELEN